MTIHQTAIEKGFWSEWYDNELASAPVEKAFPFISYKLAMIHSEVTEVLEAIRKDKGKDQITEEFADILIRVYDLYEALTLAGYVSKDLKLAVAEKANKNKGRDRLHGVAG